MKFVTLKPPLFTEKGEDSTREDAMDKGLWIAAANLWLVSEADGGSIIYQRRGENRPWAPGKLDVAVGGKVDEGEISIDAVLREAKEELGIQIDANDLTFVGKNLHVGTSEDKFVNTVPHIYLSKFEKEISELMFDPNEVDSILKVPIQELIKVNTQEGYSFDCKAFVKDGEKVIHIAKDSFPENWDNYHYKMARIAERFLKGEKEIYY